MILKYKRAHKPHQGFLLLELMVAISILCLGLIFVLRTFSTSVHALHTAENYIQAVNLLEQKAWELEEESKRKILPVHESGKFSQQRQEFVWELETEKLKDIDLDQLKLEIRWKENRRKESISLVTYLGAI